MVPKIFTCAASANKYALLRLARGYRVAITRAVKGGTRVYIVHAWSQS
jgi:hypothetical protein